MSAEERCCWLVWSCVCNFTSWVNALFEVQYRHLNVMCPWQGLGPPNKNRTFHTSISMAADGQSTPPSLPSGAASLRVALKFRRKAVHKKIELQDSRTVHASSGGGGECASNGPSSHGSAGLDDDAREHSRRHLKARAIRDATSQNSSRRLTQGIVKSVHEHILREVAGFGGRADVRADASTSKSYTASASTSHLRHEVVASDVVDGELSEPLSVGAAVQGLVTSPQVPLGQQNGADASQEPSSGPVRSECEQPPLPTESTCSNPQDHSSD